MQFKKVKKIKKTKKKPVKSSCHCLAINKDGSVAKLCPRCVAKNCKTTDAKVHCAPPTKEPTAAPTMVPTAMPTSAPTAACHCLSINKDGSVAKLCPRCVAKNCKTTDATVHCAVLHKNDQVALQFKKAKKSKNEEEEACQVLVPLPCDQQGRICG